jgi:glycosyltransferase involved in cell wall biosynthesis
MRSVRRQLAIAHVVRSPVGGVFRHIGDLARGQAEAGHAVGLVCDTRTGGELEAERIAALSPYLSRGVVRLPMPRAIGPADLTAALGVARAVAGMRPDVVHAHGAKGGVHGRLAAALRRRAGDALVAFYAPHGGSLHYARTSAAGRLYFGVERMLERLTDGLIHASAYEAGVYREKVGVPRCPAHVVHNGVRAEEFEPVQPSRAAVDFLFIGELRALKGVDVFIEALALLAHDRVHPAAVIVGPGDAAEIARYRAMVAAAGLSERVMFRPPMPARRAFALARHAVLPSRAESLPYVVLEAAAAGLPLITTDVGGIPEIIPERLHRRLLPPGNAPALAGALKAALAEPERVAAEALLCRAAVRQKFSLAGMTARIEDIYRGALEERYRIVRASGLPEADFTR